MFHIAFPVKSLSDTIAFYTNVLDAKIGRSGLNWIDFDLNWNQITVHEDNNFKKLTPIFGNESVPINHFGIILTLSNWEIMKQKIQDENIPFLIEPRIIFEGQAGEQHSFFIQDPSGYAIEYKGFKEFGKIFTKN
jgi:extradiol dioxygenase family protein